MKRLLKLLILPFLIYSTILLAQNPSNNDANTNSNDNAKRQDEIIQQVMGGGVINEKIHKEFWSTMPQEATNKAMLKWLMDHIEIAHRYQKELWQSALLSYQNKKVTKTDEYSKLDDELKKHVTENVPFPKGSKDYENFVNSYMEGNKKTEADNQAILVAAANHSSITLPDGKQLELNDKVIKNTINNLNAEYDRLKILFDPNYYSKNNQDLNQMTKKK